MASLQPCRVQVPADKAPPIPSLFDDFLDHAAREVKPDTWA
jgi:hypothetical protein